MCTLKSESFKKFDKNSFVNPSESIYSSGQTHLERVVSAVKSEQNAQTLQTMTPPLTQSFKNTAKMFTIRILGMGDAKTRALKDNLSAALIRNPVKGKVVEVSELNHITLSGVTETPALMFDNVIVSEGIVPSVEDLTKLLRNRQLYKSKLYRLRRILVPVDFSPAAENTFRFAWEIARRFGASIDLVHATEGFFEGYEASPSGFLKNYLRTIKSDLETFAQQMREKWQPEESQPKPGGPGEKPPLVKIQAKVEFGFPESVLEELSSRYDLIVMGTTGKGTVATKLFGSVSTSVSQNAHCPVLLIPPQATFSGFRNILYASNLESNDPEKIKQVVAFAKKFDAQMHFVHVGKVNEPGEQLEKVLFEINFKHSGADKPFIFEKMIGDDLVGKLHEYAFDHKNDLFVFVTPRRGFWDSLIHKSQTKKMLLNTDTPVLVVHQFNDTVSN
jgi:nucleotide-binding universal stress UspA family protein